MTNLIYFTLIILISCNSRKVENNLGEEQQMTRKQNINIVQTDTTKRPFQIIFNNVSEIRMGSPYNACEIEIVGTNKIQLPVSSWQDKYAWSDDSKNLILVKWEIDGNNYPIFKLIKVNTETGIIQESIPMLGALNSLTVEGSTVRYKKFYYNKLKSKEKLCCYVEEDYIFK